MPERKISLECPYCKTDIYRPLSWFRRSYSTCPACEQGLAAGQFDVAVAEIEQELDAQIEAMIVGRSKEGCCGKKSSCCH